MENNLYTRRSFLKKNALLGLGAVLAGSVTDLFAFDGQADVGKLALLGGDATIKKRWMKWPLWNIETDEPGVVQVLRSGVWSRNKTVAEFERKYAETIGTRRCLTVVNGTNALITALTQLGIGAGDEVIVPPYTFVATIQAVLMTGAIPVFADIDPETFQINPENIVKQITPSTRAIMPVHICGLPADMPAILNIARRHGLLVVEDACQAWMAEINHRKVGTFGNAGCFSFQTSKNLSMGEGGAIVSDDEAFMDRCQSYHNLGFPVQTATGSTSVGAVIPATKIRLTEYQAAIGLAMLKRLEGETARRNENAGYLREKLLQIPGITPYRLYDNVTRAAFHLFPFRYNREAFNGLSRETFVKALEAEGVPCSVGYSPIHRGEYLAAAFRSKNFQRMYSPQELDIERYHARNECPESDRICNEEAVWLAQNLLLGSRSDMDAIAAAVGKIQRHATELLNV